MRRTTRYETGEETRVRTAGDLVAGRFQSPLISLQIDFLDRASSAGVSVVSTSPASRRGMHVDSPVNRPYKLRPNVKRKQRHPRVFSTGEIDSLFGTHANFRPDFTRDFNLCMCKTVVQKFDWNFPVSFWLPNEAGAWILMYRSEWRVGFRIPRPRLVSKNFGEDFYVSLSRLFRRTKYRLINYTNRWGNCKKDLLNLINLSLDIVYCSTTFCLIMT
jgi:hypothetical protein